MIYDNEHTADIILERLKAKDPFSYIRFGDGDFIAMYPQNQNRVIGSNNKSLITKEIQQLIRESYQVNESNYMVGTLLPSKRSMRSAVNWRLIDELVSHPTDLYSAIALQECFLTRKNVFAEILSELRKRKTLYVNHYYEPILDILGEVTWIQVPQYNACEDWEHYLTLINTHYDYDQIILSAGQLSRVIGKKIHGEKIVLDIGSVSDMLIIGTDSFNHISQRGHIRRHRRNIQKIVKYLHDLYKHSL
jgi:hypothetical protein